MSRLGRTLTERLFHRVRLSSTCWIWTGRPIAGGYGLISLTNRAGVKYVHRLSYELFVGPVPAGHEIHHTCHNKVCVNPAHLELVTRRTHVHLTPGCASYRNAQKTHCPKGHPYTADNLSPATLARRNARRCMECSRIRDRERWPARSKLLQEKRAKSL